MMRRVPRWLGVVSTVLLAVPKPLWAVPRQLREVRTWLDVVPKVLLRAMPGLLRTTPKFLSAMRRLFYGSA